MILQPCSVLGRYGEAGWCQIFQRLLESGGRMPGLPGGSSFCDAEDLAAAFVAAASAGPGRGERYVVGGTNASSLEMQRIMAELVGVPAPSRATPPAVLRFLSRWNEVLLHLGPLLRLLRVMPRTIGSPCLVAKITQVSRCTNTAHDKSSARMAHCVLAWPEGGGTNMPHICPLISCRCAHVVATPKKASLMYGVLRIKAPSRQRRGTRWGTARGSCGTRSDGTTRG